MLQVQLCAWSTGNIRLFQPDLRAVTAAALEEPGPNPGVLVKSGSCHNRLLCRLQNWGIKWGSFYWFKWVSYQASIVLSQRINHYREFISEFAFFVFFSRIKQEQTAISFKCIYYSSLFTKFYDGLKTTAYISSYSMPFCSLSVFWNSRFMFRCDRPWKSQGNKCSLSKDTDKYLANVHFSPQFAVNNLICNFAASFL